MKKTICLLCLLALSLLPLSGLADSWYLERVDFGAKFEPKGNAILHGAGQDKTAFDLYVQTTGMTPIIYMAYASPHNDFEKKLEETALEMAAIEGGTTMLQLGMHMNFGETPDRTYYKEIASGEYDDLMRRYLRAVERVGYPVFLRIGFECNGEWNGYTDAELYAQAFRHVVELIHEMDIQNIATVWCINPDALRTDYMSYYPGDEYVDWWAIDIFRIASSWNDVTTSFLADAEAHQKPVMLSETTPYTYNMAKRGVIDGWFMHYFRFIQEHPVIKASCYISWNWPEYWDKWSNWGDARIEAAHPKVLEYYVKDMSDPIWLGSIPARDMPDRIHGFTAP